MANRWKGGATYTHREVDKKKWGLHLDLYGFIDEEEVLMTIDHIVPKSKGGINENINYQTMCKICNEMKADD